MAGLLSIIHRTHLMALNAEMKQFGLSAGQFVVLIHLSEEQNVTQDDLVRRFHIDKSAIARAVRKLEDAGYIQRITDPKNRRAVRLFLTDEGVRIIPEIIRIDRDWEKMVCGNLSQEERALLLTLLRQVTYCSLKNVDHAGNEDYAKQWLSKI